MQNYITVWISSQMRRVCATVQAFAVLAALPLCATELTHRWSFNGDYSDSAGGVDAVKCGTYVSLYGGRVHMGIGHEPNGGMTTLDIPKAELPPGKMLKIAARPLSSLGTFGRAIATMFKV